MLLIVTDNLWKVLSLERISLQNERSTAIIENGKIKMTKRLGKWDVFETSGQYLEPHVALFYMEIVCVFEQQCVFKVIT